jgi:uncharacterized protein (DUF952 family)
MGSERTVFFKLTVTLFPFRDDRPTRHSVKTLSALSQFLLLIIDDDKLVQDVDVLWFRRRQCRHFCHVYSTVIKCDVALKKIAPPNL